MDTCENCGSRVYSLGCTWCDEENYIEEQESADEESRAPDRHDDTDSGRRDGLTLNLGPIKKLEPPRDTNVWHGGEEYDNAD